MSNPWFKPHRYGMGASPSTWQGWAVTLAYSLAVTGLAIWLVPAFERGEARAMTLFILGVLALTAILVFIAWRKTSPPWRWRWGDDSDARR